MRVLAAFDKFKDALSARQACAAAAEALQGSHPGWRVEACPLTDGGEGFAEILTAAAGGLGAEAEAEGPRGRAARASFGLVPLERIPPAARRLLGLEEGPVAVVEMAAVSGLALLAPAERDPWHATSRGTGRMIRAAAAAGARAVLLGVGGSATSDLGLGALEALGLEFSAADGSRVSPPVPADWPRIARVGGRVDPSLPPIRIACDVGNPLLGPDGAAAVYGPQKGLRPEDLGRLEAEAARLARALCAHCGRPFSLAEAAGAGAAGGISFGLMAGAGARLVPGFDLVAAWLDLDARLEAADVVLTGEGRFDRSSLRGKGPGAVAALARRRGKPAHVFAGRVEGEFPPDAGLALHAITPPGTSLPAALAAAGPNLAAAVRRAFP